MTFRQTDDPAVSAAKASFSTATAYRAEHHHQLPSLREKERGRRRPDPLADFFDAEVVPMLTAAPGLRAVAIFEEMQRRHPALSAGACRTLERRVRAWRALHGADQEVIFRQVHEPGRMWQDMNLGIAAVFGDFLEMPLARTFELYELWCFLRLVRAGVEEFGPAGVMVDDLFISDAAGGLTVAAGAVTVPVGAGLKLCFQKKYREFWIEPDRRGSFSRIMEPDVAAMREPGEAPEGGGEAARLIILDAKYRISEGLNDALSSIHTDRDALVREVQGGIVEAIARAAIF